MYKKSIKIQDNYLLSMKEISLSARLCPAKREREEKSEHINKNNNVY